MAKEIDSRVVSWTKAPKAKPKDKKPSGLKKDGTPNATWSSFIKRTHLYESLELKDWNQDQVLGYLLSLYKKQYGMDWNYSYNGPPGKCPEMYCLQRVYNELTTKDHLMVKDYIDWVFEKKVIPGKLTIKSLGFFFTKTICNEYRYKLIKDNKTNKINKSKELPNDYIQKANEFGISVNTYGDLAFAKMALDQLGDNIPKEYVPYRNLFVWLNQKGFNKSVLDSLE